MSTRDSDAKPAPGGDEEGDHRVSSRPVNRENRHHRGAQPSHQGDKGDTQSCNPLAETGAPKTDTPHETIYLLNEGLRFDLSLEDTIAAHIRLGNDWSALNDHDRATLHYDCAFHLAHKCGRTINGASLSTFFRLISSGYLAQANVIRQKEGLDHCFDYLDTKERLLNGRASPGFYLELGNIYDEKHPFEFDRIRLYYAKATECTVADGNDEAAVRAARENLRIIEKQRAYFATRPHLPAVGRRPQRKNHRTAALIGASGVFLVMAGFVARPYLPIGIARRPVTEKTQGPVAGGTVITEGQPTAVKPETVTPALRTDVTGNVKPTAIVKEAPRTVKAATRQQAPARSLKRPRPLVRVAEPTKDRVNRKTPRKSFAPPSRENL